MKPKKKNEPESDLFLQRLDVMLDQRNDLYKLAHVLDWEFFEMEFEELYADTGRPALPIRRMVGLLLLKQLKNLSDEAVCAAWKENPYMQYFCGEDYFRWSMPCAPNELVYFRQRIGSRGVEKILEATVKLHSDKVETETVHRQGQGAQAIRIWTKSLSGDAARQRNHCWGQELHREPLRRRHP